jgi:DNA end-binding protein Ku
MAKTTGPRPIWSGSINFGLVTIPVRLYTAVREKDLHFRSLHDQDHMPLKMKMVCSADGKEVHREHIVKGFEVEKDHFVVVHQDELEAVAPKATKSIEILDFVDLDEIDPVYFDKPYYVAPKPEGAKPYKLLMQAMSKTKKVGIAKVVMHNKEHLAALRPLDDVLCLDTMHFSDEVVDSDDVSTPDVKAKVDEREMQIAQRLIDSLSTDFKPERYKDEYRDRVMEMIEQKAKGQEVVFRPEEEGKPSRSRDLIAALEASLAKAKGGGGGGAATARPVRHTARRRRSA